jgi:hypothetical protein
LEKGTGSLRSREADFWIEEQQGWSRKTELLEKGTGSLKSREAGLLERGTARLEKRD